MEANAQNLSEGDLRGSAAVILALAGTNPYPFTRLLRAVDEWSRSSGEYVIAQSGHTPVEGMMIECHSFVSHAQILEWISQSSVVICQGGLGSLRDCLRAGKPTVAVPRKPELGESQDLQSELVEVLVQEGRVIAVDNIEHLAQAIEKARHMPIRKGEESRIPQIVADKVHSVLGLA
jgi:UDP-N-acetylglucosamine transferase subunit ALG13